MGFYSRERPSPEWLTTHLRRIAKLHEQPTHPRWFLKVRFAHLIASIIRIALTIFTQANPTTDNWKLDLLLADC